MSTLPVPATHHGMAAFDICAFGRRSAALHPYLRDAMYRIVTDCLAEIGTPLDACDDEDRGDGIMVIAPPETSVELLLSPLPVQLRLALRQYNRHATREAQLRLRMAVNAGYLRRDRKGFTGDALIRLFRLLDAAEFKAALTAHGGELGLITSDDVHRQLIHDSPGLVDAAAFKPIEIANKETTGPAWIWLPPAASSLTADGSLAAPWS